MKNKMRIPFFVSAAVSFAPAISVATTLAASSGARTQSGNSNANSARAAVPSHADPLASPTSSPEPVSPQVMNQKLQQYNEMSRRVHDRHFRGAGDEDQLKVLAALPKPERGVIGSQMQAQDDHERTDDTAGDENHD